MNEQTREEPGAATTVRKANKGKIFAIISIAVILMLAILGFAAIQISSLLGEQKNLAQRETLKSDGNMIITQEEEDIAGVVSKVSPSVVSVITTSTRTNSRLGAEEQGAGTGIIVSSDGYVLTNKHVVSGASTVEVILSDGTSYDNAKVVGSDPLNDVAFLKIPDVKDLPKADLGDSTSIRVGQKVIAIGNSLGQYQNTVTSGIVSGTGRPVAAQDGEKIESLTDLIQTDAAINPGNSGGPLLNLQGQVIGLNTAIVEDAQGIGFAIPISATKGVMKGVLKNGKVERAFLGISYIPITAAIKKEYDLPVGGGAYVFAGQGKSAIVSDGPAAKAGIKDGDIITKVGNINVGDRGSVASLVAEYAPGDTINLTVFRDGKSQVMQVTLAIFKS